MRPVRTAVVGVGHLGKEHARILGGLPGAELVGVADVNAEQAQAVARRCGCPAYTDFKDLIPLVEAAVVAVPTQYHAPVAEPFLQRGIPLLIEKPLCTAPEQAEQLVALARERGTFIQVGHIERFNPAVEELRRRPLVPKFVRGERVGPFTGRSTDIGVVLDLMIHDLDLLLDLVAAPVVSIQALGVAVFGGHEDIANARLTFADGCVADLTASRASYHPSRQMQVWSAEGFAGIDFARRTLRLVQPSQRLRTQGLDPRRLTPAALATLKDDLFGHYFEVLDLNCNRHGPDALTCELEDFLDCVRTGAAPRVPGEDGRDAVALAACIVEELRRHPWEGTVTGATGPNQFPAPAGLLFHPPAGEAAA